MGLMKVNKDTDGTLTLGAGDQYEMVLRENSSTVERNRYAYVDADDNIQHIATLEDMTGNIDGGRADSTYTLEQNITGGNA